MTDMDFGMLRCPTCQEMIFKDFRHKHVCRPSWEVFQDDEEDAIDIFADDAETAAEAFASMHDDGTGGEWDVIVRRNGVEEHFAVTREMEPVYTASRVWDADV